MKNRAFLLIALMSLFVVLQTSIPLHAITHITTDAEQSGDEHSLTHALCEQCLAQAQADTADVPTIFTVSLHCDQHVLSTAFVAELTLRTRILYNVRAPPASLLIV